jgi:predicted dehydrogenase
MPRRRFLELALLTASCAPFGRTARAAPRDRIAVGVIGVGMQGRGILQGLLHRGDVDIVAVSDVDTNRREHARGLVDARDRERGQARATGCAAYNDFRALLDSKDVQAVVIATPDHWHAVMGILAAQAGKDIFCEKPLTQSIAEARALVRAVRDNKRIFQVGSQQRSASEFRVACELVRNGHLGKLSEVRVAVGGPAVWCGLGCEAPEPGLDWELWLGPAAMRPYHSELSPRGVHQHFPAWRQYREYGGGGVTDWGAHHFDIAQWALDADGAGPVDVVPPEAKDAQSGVVLSYASGVRVVHDAGNGVTFIGDKGKVYVNRGQLDIELRGVPHARGLEPARALARELLAKKTVKLAESQDHMGNFLECVRSRQRPICDVEVGARSVSVCHLVNLAYYHRQRLRWDPVAERFVDKTGHPSWLDVPRRPPWVI